MLNVDKKEKIKLLADELAAIETRRKNIVNELNEQAYDIDYNPNNYDEATYWDAVFTGIAYKGNLGYQGHRLANRETFWVPSGDNC